MTTIIDGIGALPGFVGQHLGYSDYVQITQEQVNQFADATGDHQWIHVDVEKAKAGPFGTPIAHGYLTLALAPAMLPQILQVQGVTMGVNYGLNKVRFMSPVPVGAKVRAGAVLARVDEIAGGAQVTMTITFEIEGNEKPACVAEAIFRHYA